RASGTFSPGDVMANLPPALGDRRRGRDDEGEDPEDTHSMPRKLTATFEPLGRPATHAPMDRVVPGWASSGEQKQGVRHAGVSWTVRAGERSKQAGRSRPQQRQHGSPQVPWRVAA